MSSQRQPCSDTKQSMDFVPLTLGGEKNTWQVRTKTHYKKIAHRKQEIAFTALLLISHNPLTSNYRIGFRGADTKIIPVRGRRFEPACCAAQSVIRRGPFCAVAHHRVAQAAQLKDRSGLHQLRATAKKMKTSILLFTTGVKQIMQCGLTGRSTGPIAAGWHLGYKKA